MGIFDALTGKAGKEAAEKNRILYQQLETKGLGYLDTGLNKATGALDTAKTEFAPLSDLATKYGAGTGLYLGALGAGGPEGTEAARAAFTASPGYQFTLDQGLDAINRRRAAAGMLASGNADRDATTYAEGLARQDYDKWRASLSTLINPELAATTTAATGRAGVDTGQAGLYSQDALNRVDLSKTTTGGFVAANNAEAQAKTAGSANLIKLGENLLKLAVGAYGGYGGGSG